MSRFAGELRLFLRQNKKLWLIPLILTVVLIVVLLILARFSERDPFIYTIF